MSEAELRELMQMGGVTLDGSALCYADFVKNCADLKRHGQKVRTAAGASRLTTKK